MLNTQIKPAIQNADTGPKNASSQLPIINDPNASNRQIDKGRLLKIKSSHAVEPDEI